MHTIHGRPIAVRKAFNRMHLRRLAVVVWLLLPLASSGCATKQPAEEAKKAEAPAAKTEAQTTSVSGQQPASKAVRRSVRIVSVPAEAEIVVDHNALSGKLTPADIELSEGQHVVQVKKADYEASEERTISVSGDQTPKEVAFTLRSKAPEEVTINVRCDPTTAALVVDGMNITADQGKVALKRPKTFEKLSLKASATSHAPLERTIARADLEAAGYSVVLRLNPYLQTEPREADIRIDGKLVAADAEGRRELGRNTSDQYDLVVSRPGYQALEGKYSYDDLRQQNFKLTLKAEPKSEPKVEAKADTWLQRAEKLARQSGWQNHTKTVYSVAFSLKDRLFASAGRDNLVRLSSYPDKELFGGMFPPTPAGELKHDKPVLAVAFSPDAKWLATGSADKKARLWNIESRQVAGEMPQDEWVWAVAFTHDGTKLAVGSADGKVSLWAVPSRDAVGKPKKLHEEMIRAIAFSPDDRTLASASLDGTIALWTVGSDDSTTLGGSSKAVQCLAFSPDGATLATAGDDNMVTLWDVAKRQKRSTLGTHSQPVRALAYSPDGRVLASAGSDKVIKLWNVSSGKQLQALTCNEELYCLAFSPTGWLLAAGGGNGGVTVWRSSDIQ